jgi:hypothetical protein
MRIRAESEDRLMRAAAEDHCYERISHEQEEPSAKILPPESNG